MTERISLDFHHCGLRPVAHMGFEGSRHLFPERLPSARRDRAVGLRVIDLTENTIRNVQRLAGSLKRLDMSDLHLDVIDDELTEGLFRLEKIDLNHNVLTDQSFPENFRNMEQLMEFSAHGNQLTEMPKVLKKLKNLHRLKLSGNNINKVDGMERLKRLQQLVLDGNCIATLTKELCTNVRRLEVLHCAQNELTGIPPEIRNLRYLKELNLSDNQLSYLPPEVFLLPRLQVLNASGNQISRLPTLNVKRQHQNKLVCLDLSDNQLTRFPAHLMFMTDKLDLSCNRIKSVPLSLIDKLDQVGDLSLHLSENPITVPPSDVCDGGLRSIIQYFTQVKSDMKIYQGLKVLVLGPSDAGKTSLVQTLVEQQTRLSESERTIGVDIYEHSIGQDDGDPLGERLELSLWDFSGHPRYLFQNHYFLQQASLVLLVFNMAEYDDSVFNEMLGSWIDWVKTRYNRVIALPVGTHSDKLPAKRVKETCEKVSARITEYIGAMRQSIDKEIKRITNKSSISPALSEQLTLYVNLTKLEIRMYDKVIPVSSKKFRGFGDLEEAIKEMATDKNVFPNVMRPIPTLWGEVQNFVDDRGYAMQIPMLSWDEYVDMITAKFGMRHLIQAITVYLHDTGKVLWFQEHPTLKNLVFLRPSWLVDVLKAVFRHDIGDIDYKLEESFQQYGVTLAKLERMKIEITKEGLLERDFIKCLWSNTFKTDSNRTVLEVLHVLLESFYVGYPVSAQQSRRTSMVSKTSSSVSSGDKEKSETDSRSNTGSVSVATTKVKASSSETSTPKPSPPKISKVLIPWLRQDTPPRGFREEYNKYVTSPCITAVFRFPKYMYPGLFEMFTVLVQKNEFDLEPLHHWKNGLYARNTQCKVRFYLQRIDHGDGGTCVRSEVRPEFTSPGSKESNKVLNEVKESTSDDEREKTSSKGQGSVASHDHEGSSNQGQNGTDNPKLPANVEQDRRASLLQAQSDEHEKASEQLWKVLLPFLKEAEDIMAKLTGLRMERYMECPYCHSLSFLGEWLTPKELQGADSKKCEICKANVSASYLVQPKEKRRVEEFLQKLLQEAAERRQRAKALQEREEVGRRDDANAEETVQNET